MLRQVLEEGSAYLVEGTVRATGPLLAAPLTGRPCVAYVAHARVWSQLDLPGVLVDDLFFRELAPFVLDGSDGPIVVDTKHFELDRPSVEIFDERAARLLPAELQRYLRSTFSDETILSPGDFIRVRGVIAHARDPASAERGYRDAPLRMQITGYADRPLRIE